MDVFTDTFVPPGLEAWFASRGCPACGSRLAAAPGCTEAHWVCGECQSCWRAEHGALHRTDALTCRGCAARDKRDCIDSLQRRFPRFVAGAASDPVLA